MVPSRYLYLVKKQMPFMKMAKSADYENLMATFRNGVKSSSKKLEWEWVLGISHLALLASLEHQPMPLMRSPFKIRPREWLICHPPCNSEMFSSRPVGLCSEALSWTHAKVCFSSFWGLGIFCVISCSEWGSEQIFHSSFSSFYWRHQL